MITIFTLSGPHFLSFIPLPECPPFSFDLLNSYYKFHFKGTSSLNPHRLQIGCRHFVSLYDTESSIMAIISHFHLSYHIIRRDSVYCQHYNTLAPAFAHIVQSHNFTKILLGR